VIAISELARALGAEAVGEVDLVVRGPAEPAAAGTDQIALAMMPSFAGDLAKGQARAAILWQGADWQALGLQAAIFAPRARYVLAGVTRIFEPVLAVAPGIHPLAVVDPTAELGPDCAVGPFVAIGPRARIGAGARIVSHVSIGADAVIGRDALLHAGARIGDRVRIGDRFIAQPGAVVGADGFSFVTPTPGHVEEARASGVVSREQEAYVRINSLGAVVLGDDVEIGANSCIDRGTIADTTIGNGTKIDNLVQIGHNVQIGEHCIIVAQVGISGSTEIGANVMIAGQVGIIGHIEIGAGAQIGAKSGVSKSIKPGEKVFGYPALPVGQAMRIEANLRHLPELVQSVRALRRRVEELEGGTNGSPTR
jgi:UDP-3-O-[3-hydroxymyristoyl] glucosamine N-acyltransferase